ncbi:MULTISPECIES: SDR family oxidoreductase [Kitasatospora]|uniref:NADP-dependent 3-hydroxy acid dehydrogenase YdfG n=2 Tax=Kitasatospora TaxID=2063 RepID=A0ABT1JAH5_9ACTN|nr:SDR family oxidoreductase [Kitasatospora paracochleata]MCP2314452.1 NADP-dependent 3-hydroxy acid dehydrogenase YdfG [Kitasatospora paracochleata]
MGVHLITGSGSGIGAAVAALLAQRGEELWLLARDAARAEQLRGTFPGSRTLVADLAEPAALASVLADQKGPDHLDSLLHVAGVIEPGTVADLAADRWYGTLAVNLLAPAELTRLVLPALRAARGHVVFLNSGAGLHAPPGLGAYAASKFALKALAESLRAEEYPYGVRVTAVYPGEVDTPMQVRLHERLGLPYDPSTCLTADSVAATVVGALDLPRDGMVSDVMLRPGC